MTKNFYLQKYFLFLLLIPVVFLSCTVGKKAKEKKIVGVWEIVDVIDPADTVKERWSFESNGNMAVLSIEGTIVTVINSGLWSIDQKIRTTNLNIAFGTKLSGYGDIWELVKLNKKEMILILKEGGLSIKEFKKVK